jgi:hypothetical protein
LAATDGVSDGSASPSLVEEIVDLVETLSAGTNATTSRIGAAPITIRMIITADDDRRR